SRKPASRRTGRSRTRATTSTTPPIARPTKSRTPPTDSTERRVHVIDLIAPPRGAIRSESITEATAASAPPRSPGPVALAPTRRSSDRHRLEDGFDGVHLAAVNLERLERDERILPGTEGRAPAEVEP